MWYYKSKEYDETPEEYQEPNSTFRVSASASNITAGSSSVVNDGDGNATIVRFGAHSNALTDTPVITYTITVKNGVGSTITLTRFQHFAVVTDGVVGANGLSIIPTNGTHNFVGDAAGAASATSFSSPVSLLFRIRIKILARNSK